MSNSVAYYASYMFCNLKELPPLIMTIALIPIETTIIGPSALSAVMLDSGYLYFGCEVSSIINDEILLA